MSVLARQMPPVQRAPINGLDLAYYEVGPRRGVPVIFCHGFPEIAFSWRHQLRAFEAAGRCAVAPDMRGYGLTGGPKDVVTYDIEHLTGDLVALLDHFGQEKAVFCGHDWGAIVAWQMPLMHHNRCAGIIGLNTPFLPRPWIDPVELFAKLWGPETYIAHFQKPGEADALFVQDVEKTMRFFMRRPGPSLSPPDSPSAFAFQLALPTFDPANDAHQFLEPQELAAFVEMFQRTGFSGPINWYRNLTRNWERSAHLPTRVDGVPCLMLMAENDAVLTPAMAHGMKDLIGDLETVLIEDCGHWTQQEKPDEVNRVILDWMERRFSR